MPELSCNPLSAAGILSDVELRSPARLVDMYGQMSAAEVNRMRRLLGGPVRRMRVLKDGPDYDLAFRPFLTLSPQDPELVIVPMSPDTSPMASVLLRALRSIL